MGEHRDDRGHPDMRLTALRRFAIAISILNLAGHTVRWHWVRGHTGHVENERVDVLARDMAVKMRDAAQAAMLSGRDGFSADETS